MDLHRKIGLKSRNLWRKLLKLLITLFTKGVWKSRGGFGICENMPFFHNTNPHGKLYKFRLEYEKTVEKWK